MISLHYIFMISLYDIFIFMIFLYDIFIWYPYMIYLYDIFIWYLYMILCYVYIYISEKTVCYILVKACESNVYNYPSRVSPNHIPVICVSNHVGSLLPELREGVRWTAQGVFVERSGLDGCNASTKFLLQVIRYRF